MENLNNTTKDKDLFIIKYGRVGGKELTEEIHGTEAEAIRRGEELTEAAHEYAYIYVITEDGHLLERNYIWHEH